MGLLYYTENQKDTTLSQLCNLHPYVSLHIIPKNILLY